MSEQLFLWPDDQPGDRITWSVSRDRRLRDCLRKYYLQHYASRGGQKADAPPETRELYVLKHLRNRYMWVGEVVHEMLDLALSAWRRGDSVPVEALVERGTRRMRVNYAESIQGVYRERPRVACGLVEHEYREEIPRAVWKEQRDRMERCVRTFFGLEVTRQIRATPPWRWLAVETLASFELDGSTVLVKPDFAWRDEEDRVILVDWKTGRPHGDDERLQLGVYGLFAREAWGAREDHLLGQLVYLETGDIDEVRLDAEELAAAEEAVRASLGEMRNLAAGANGGGPDADRFSLAADRSRCVSCPFRRACGR